jgi:hypothetical protein
VRQRQPHGAHLLPARREAVEDTPRHDEVGLRVVVAEDEIRAEVHGPRCDAGETGHYCEQSR